MITAIAIDDEPLALEIIAGFCQKIDFIRLEKTFTRSAEALLYINQFPIDLLFLDINMPSLSGIELYRATAAKRMTIFTTAYSKYAVEGFNLNAVDYLLKPYTFERFQQAADKALQIFIHQPVSSYNTLLLKAGCALIKITHILFIEGKDDYLNIHLQNKKTLLVRMTMKTILSRLPPKLFVRVHRSYIISLRHIENISTKTIYLSGIEIPIGATYEKDFFNRYQM